MLSGLTKTRTVWQSNGLPKEKTKPLATSNNILFPKLEWHNSKIRVEIKGSCLKQDKVTFTPNNIQ